MFASRGWSVIDADKAFRDPVFQREPDIVPAGESLVWALAKETGRYEALLRYPGEDSVTRIRGWTSCGCACNREGRCSLAVVTKPERSHENRFRVGCFLPWCAVGLKSWRRRWRASTPEVSADLHFQPFELNPQMGPQGQDIVEHIAEKYGSSADIGRSQEALKARGDALGFTFDFQRRSRIYNTFDAHRLLHWAEGEGKQHALEECVVQRLFHRGEGSEQPRCAGERGRQCRSRREARTTDPRVRRVCHRGP